MSNPIVGFDTPAGWFGPNGFFTMPADNYEVELKDGNTGYAGDGDYVVTFTCDELAVYGVGAHAPAIHVIGRTASNPIASPYDMRVHKMAQYLVIGGVLMGSRDLRVLGGVNSANIDPAALTNAVTNTNQGTTLTTITAIEPLEATSGMNPIISIIDPLPIANGGTGTPTPALRQGTGISLSGPFPDTQISNTGVLSVTALGPLGSSGGQNPSITIATPLPISDGGTGNSAGSIPGSSISSPVPTTAGGTGNTQGTIPGTSISSPVPTSAGGTGNTAGTIPGSAISSPVPISAGGTGNSAGTIPGSAVTSPISKANGGTGSTDGSIPGSAISSPVPTSMGGTGSTDGSIPGSAISSPISTAAGGTGTTDGTIPASSVTGVLSPAQGGTGTTTGNGVAVAGSSNAISAKSGIAYYTMKINFGTQYSGLEPNTDVGYINGSFLGSTLLPLSGSGPMTGEAQFHLQVTAGAGAQHLSGVVALPGSAGTVIATVFLDGTQISTANNTALDWSVNIPDNGAMHLLILHVNTPNGPYMAQWSSWVPKDANGGIDASKFSYIGV